MTSPADGSPASLELEHRLRTAILAFVDAWRAEAGSHLEPAHPEKLVEIEGFIAAPLPPSVRVVLEAFDGTYVPVSPRRPDVVMCTSAISSRLAQTDMREVVPLIECELDPETGIQRVLGVAVADPWGPLRQGDGTTDDAEAPTTLIEWFEQVTTENETYVWPAPKQITPKLAWSPCAEVSQDDLRSLPVGAAIAVHQPDSKRNRIELQLFVQVDTDVWVRGIHRKHDAALTFHEMCVEASNMIEREIRRAHSQWAISCAGVVPSLRHELFVGTVEIEDKVRTS